jgi:hypothetical protein
MEHTLKKFEIAVVILTSSFGENCVVIWAGISFPNRWQEKKAAGGDHEGVFAV